MTQETTSVESTETIEDQEALKDLQIVHEAADATAHLLGEESQEQTTTATLSPQGAATIEKSQVVDLRAKRREWHEKNKALLSSRHDGVLSLILQVEINEERMGRHFNNFFYPMETALFSIYRNGSFYLPADQYDFVLKAVNNHLVKLEQSLEKATAEAGRVQALHADAQDLSLSYSNPYVNMEVQLRTPQAKRLLDVFTGFDKVLGALRVIAWYGEIENAAIDHEQAEFSREIRDFGILIARTSRAMRLKLMNAETVEKLGLAVVQEEATA